MTSLPERIGKLKNLIRLDLGSNSLTNLTEYMGELKNLTYIDLGGNPIPMVEQEKIRQTLIAL